MRTFILYFRFFSLAAAATMPFFCLADMDSTNFKITSDVIGSFGSKDTSTSFELGDTGGEVGTGNSSSTSFDLGAGFWNIAGDDGVLIFNITSNLVDMGVFSQSEVRYGTAAFNVATNAQGGYVVQFSGNTLTSDANTIDPLAISGASQPGTEQFGFNLVSNTNPSIGTNPSGGFGHASTGYNVSNAFKFVSGDTIAESSTPSNQTNYIVSFIGNINDSIEAGQYSTSLTVIATGRY